MARNYKGKAKKYGKDFYNSGKYTYSSAKRISRDTYRKAAQKKTGIAFIVMLFVALLAPAVAGYYMDGMTGVGVPTVIASNGDTNSSIILESYAAYCDGTTKYNCDMITVDGYDYFMTSPTDDSYASALTSSWGAYIFNASYLEDIDSIKVFVSSDDVNFADINASLSIDLNDGVSNVKQYTFDDFDYDNESNSFTCDVIITPDVLLKLQGLSTFKVLISGLPGQEAASGNTYQAAVQLIDTVGVDSETTSNIFFGGSGVVLLIGAFACTPYFNPTKELEKLRRR